MAQMAEMGGRPAVVSWFESSFKESAKATTRTSRLDDGKLSYKFSVVNDSGFDFENFSFNIKVINKADSSEIGTARIKAGKWRKGEKKSFSSKLVIPPDVKSLSFVMYSNSLDYELIPFENVNTAFKDVESTFKDIGSTISGSDGSGGIFGELFGTGGMPGADSANSGQTASAAPRSSGGPTVTKSGSANNRSTGTAQRQASSGEVKINTHQRPSGGQRGAYGQTASFRQRKNEKKLNKKRLGKSGWTVTSIVVGLMFLLAALGSDDDPTYRIGCAVIGALALAAAGVIKMVLGSKAKRIRAYETRINKKGNTSLDDLAAYVGRPFKKVADDLQQMIVDGFFEEAYVDIDNRLLVMTRNGQPLESVEKSAAVNNAARRKAARDKNLAPESLDDLIVMTDDAEIKSKLKALRTITKKIDARVEAVPDLEKQVRDFREKYYPEVVRLTDDYNEKIADMGDLGGAPKEAVTTDSTGAPVLNTNPNYLQEQAEKIKSQLIELIDSVTEASENLLERLHEDDIMDITTDIQMLQTTLASKGLLDSDFDIKS